MLNTIQLDENIVTNMNIVEVFDIFVNKDSQSEYVSVVEITINHVFSLKKIV